MKLYSLTLDNMINNANNAKEVVVDGLIQEGFLTKEQGEEINNRYAVMITEKGLFGKILDKLLFKKDDSIVTIFMKLI